MKEQPLPPGIEVIKIDPLRLLTISDVVEKTGLSQRSIFRKLADDRINKTPGRSFPMPVENPLRKGRLEWSALAFAKWMLGDK